MNTLSDSSSGSAASAGSSSKQKKATELWLYLIQSAMGVFTVLAALDRLNNTHERNTILTLVWLVTTAFIIEIVWFAARKERKLAKPDEFAREWQRASFTFLALCCVALAVLASLTRAH